MTEPRPNALAGLSALKLALMARQVRQQAQAVLRADPVAIVGLACRVPGGGDTPEAFWRLLCDGIDAVGDIPGDRWDGSDWFDADPSAIGKTVTCKGAFLDRIDGFDAEYFGVLPREAARMDPQQRLFLEVAIEALDDAGLSRERLKGTRTGVYVASYHNDYAQLQYGDAEEIDPRTLTGTLHSVLTGRLSHLLDLRGPSISIDTACSSSLVAIHLACESLRSGETDLAAAGGVSLMISPELLVSMSKVGFMAPDGRCKTFDASADGFGRGEGCGIVVLKRLADAVADGDRIHAVIRATALNQDGHSTLLTAPHGPAQEALIGEALDAAQIEPGRIGLVETHGTGTALGDPIEVEAIAATLGRAGADAGPCWLGAVKANVGHLEAAAGVTGLIKAVLALEHEAVPPQVHFSRLSPHISLDGTRLAVPTRLEPWRAGAVPRCASVSSFGVSGTNAHVIVEEAPVLPSPGDALAHEASRVLPLSANSPQALRASAQAWVEFLSADTAKAVDICHTASLRRTHYDCRLAVVGRTKDEWRLRLDGFLREGGAPGLAVGRRPATTVPRLGFVFCGQGPQWFGMGRELLTQEPAFRDVVTECDSLLRPLSGWSLLDELARPEEASRLGETRVAQPALFALQAALATLLRSWGLAPDGVVGHSVGEVAALHEAGVLGLPEAIRVVWHRGRLMQEATGLGRMASVGLAPEEAAELIGGCGDRLSIAAINGPRSVVLSGEATVLDSVLASLAARGVSHRLLPVDYAFHSAQMAPFQHRLVRELAGMQAHSPRIALYSTVTGGSAAALAFDAAYFGRNLREPVRFAAAIGAMADDGFDVLVEVGPHPVLGSAIAECLESRVPPAIVLASLRRGRDERESLLQASAGAFAAGIEPRWEAFQQAPGDVVSLPAYCWQRKRHWIRPRPEPAARHTRGAGMHPLLGRPISAATGVRIFEGGPSISTAWLADHRIFGHAVLPAAAVLDMFGVAAGIALGEPRAVLKSFTMERPLFLRERDARPAAWQTVVTTPTAGRVDIELHEAMSVSDGETVAWRRVAAATAARADAPQGEAGTSAAALTGDVLPADGVYRRLEQLGIAFGPAFRRLGNIRRAAGVAEAWIDLPSDRVSDPAEFAVHPILLDGALQLCSLVAASHGEVPAAAMLPLGADSVRLERTISRRLFARATVRSASDDTLATDLVLEDSLGVRVGAIEGMRFARAHPAAFGPGSAADDLVYRVAWHRSPAPGDPGGGEGHWLVFGDGGGFADSLCRELEAVGGRCWQARAGPRFERLAKDRWIVDPADPAGFRRLLEEVGEQDAKGVRGVVHLWSLDIGPLDTEPDDADRDDLLGVGSVLHLVQALVGSPRFANARFWQVTLGARVVHGDENPASLRPRAAGAWGFARALRQEHPELAASVIDLDPGGDFAAGLPGLMSELLGRRRTGEDCALRGSTRWVERLERHRGASDEAHARPALRLECVRPGTLDGVALRAVPRESLKRGEIRLRVLASGINFRDVLLALGMYAGPRVPLGAECAGVVIETGPGVTEFAIGQRVFGFAPGSLGTQCVVPAAFLAPIPVGLGAEAAAALPVACLTAFHGLHRLAALAAGERVLVHAAAGGVGLAAVQLAQRLGAEVFATAGSDEKRALLRSLGVRHVMDSRSLAFADEVLAATQGEGVHVVLNSLAGEFIAASLRALGRAGRFLELGKRDILTPEDAHRLRPDIRYHAYDLGSLAQADHAFLRPMLDGLLGELAAGRLRPLPVTTFGLDHAQDALRFMAQSRHTGKIVVRPDDAGERNAPAAIRADATYLVTGGLGAIGIETARWLARSGARQLALVGRRPPSDVATVAVKELESLGVTVRIFAADCADRTRMLEVFHEIDATMAPLRGIVHAAGVLHDGVLRNQRWDDCRGVLRGKARGAWVLHALSRARDLDFLILYSAAGVLLGASGQGVYPAANAELDALAHARRRMGLPALSVAWGAWADAGMAVDSAAHGRNAWSDRGVGELSADAAFDALAGLLRDGVAHAAVLPIDWSRFLARRETDVDRLYYGAVAPVGPQEDPGSGQGNPVPDLPARLREQPAARRRDALLAHLSERALVVLGLDPGRIVDPRIPLKEMGLDSLMAVELRNQLARSTGVALPATLLFDYPTLDALAGHLGGVLGLELEAADASVRPARSALQAAKAQLAALSDEEAEAQLLAELDGRSPSDRPS